MWKCQAQRLSGPRRSGFSRSRISVQSQDQPGTIDEPRRGVLSRFSERGLLPRLYHRVALPNPWPESFLGPSERAWPWLQTVRDVVRRIGHFRHDDAQSDTVSDVSFDLRPDLDSIRVLHFPFQTLCKFEKGGVYFLCLRKRS